MNNKDITILIMSVIIITMMFIILYLMIKLNKNIFLGGYRNKDFPTKIKHKIITDLDAVYNADEHCKNLILTISKNFKVGCNVDNEILYENNEELNTLAKNIYKIPDVQTFKPDAIIDDKKNYYRV